MPCSSFAKLEGLVGIMPVLAACFSTQSSKLFPGTFKEVMNLVSVSLCAVMAQEEVPMRLTPRPSGIAPRIFHECSERSVKLTLSLEKANSIVTNRAIFKDMPVHAKINMLSRVKSIEQVWECWNYIDRDLIYIQLFLYLFYCKLNYRARNTRTIS